MKKTGQWVTLEGLGSAQNAERGLTLIEILVALGILAAVAVVFLLGMSTSSKAVMVSQKAVAVDSLAKSQMEYIKSQPYDDDLNHNPPQYLKLADEDIPDGYDIIITPARLDPGDDGLDDDDGLQEITVTVTHDTAFTLVGYKVNTGE